MPDAHAAEVNDASGSLWRWLVGGLAVGGAILGLLIGAYAIGYDRGKHHASGASAAPARGATTTTAATTTASSPGTLGRVAVTPALVARGKALYTADGCVACHSLSGSAGAGPALNGVAGSTVTLADGSTVRADDSYLERSIVDPDAQLVKGYRAGVMPAAIASFKLESKPDDIRALVAFLKSRKS